VQYITRQILKFIWSVKYVWCLRTGTHQLLVYADDVNLLGDNIHTIKKNTGTLIKARKEVSLEVNTEKTKHMMLSCHQNAGQNHDIKIPDMF
jgi:hypothetical protein